MPSKTIRQSIYIGDNPEELSVLSGHECCDSCQEEELNQPKINGKETAMTVINAIQELCGLSRFNDGVNEGNLSRLFEVLIRSG